MTSVSYTTHNLSWFSFFPRIARLCMFKVAVLPEATCYQKYFLPMRLFGTQRDFNLDRAKDTIKALKVLGKSTQLETQDGEALLDVIHFKASKIKENIEQFGGSWEKVGNKIIIQRPKKPFDGIDPNWKSYYANLEKIFGKEQTIDGVTGIVTCYHAHEIPVDIGEASKTKCVLFAKLAKTYALNKRDIAFFLGMGLDVCVYDPPGAMNSIGYPSEASLYSAIETVGDFLFTTQGYKPSETLIYGSCGESFIATHLFKEYHNQGINLLLQAPPKSMNAVVNTINYIARRIFNWVKIYLQAPFLSNCDKTKEDFFDSENKIRNLEADANGFVILLAIEGDTTSPPKGIQEMADLFKDKGADTLILRSKAGEDLPPGITDLHLSQPLHNQRLQKEIINKLLK